MKERPILFSATMVRALLAGTKTQTRRVVKMKTHHQIEERDNGTPWPWMYDGERDADSWMACPYGQPGDRLWVRETWRTDARLDDKAPNAFSGWPVKYEADSTALNHGAFFGQTDGKTRVSIHMPRWASRITLEITGVRVERLQDISEADALAEGIEDRGKGFAVYGTDDGITFDPIRSYRSLWEQINGPGSWDANPWVWVVEFRSVEAAAK